MAEDPVRTPADPPAPVLLVDDRPANLVALAAVLDGMGLDLVATASGEEAPARHRDGFLRTLGDNLPSGFIYRVGATPDGGRQFTYLSAGVERLFGVPPSEALADAGAVYRLVHPDDAARVAAAEAAALAG